MATNLSKFRREATEEPYVLTYEKDGETKHLKLKNPNRLKGRKFAEFVKRAEDFEYGFKVLAGDAHEELWDALDREGIDGEGIQALVQDVMEHYGFDAGEASASST